MVDFENCSEFYVVVTREGICHVCDNKIEANLKAGQASLDGSCDVRVIKYTKFDKNLFKYRA